MRRVACLLQGPVVPDHVAPVLVLSPRLRFVVHLIVTAHDADDAVTVTESVDHPPCAGGLLYGGKDRVPTILTPLHDSKIRSSGAGCKLVCQRNAEPCL